MIPLLSSILVTHDHSLAFSFLSHCSGDHDVLLPISDSMLSGILFCTLLKHIHWLFSFKGGLAFLLQYTVLKIYALAILLQIVSWPGFEYALFL